MNEHRVPGAKVCTGESRAYGGLENHETVRHSVAEYSERQGAHERRRESARASDHSGMASRFQRQRGATAG